MPRSLRRCHRLLLLVGVLSLCLLAAEELDGRAHYRGDAWALAPLARQVAAHAVAAPGVNSFPTGSARFDGEWALGTCQMSVLGLVQVSLDHPELAAELAPGIAACSDWLLSDAAADFSRRAWGRSWREGLGQAQGGEAWLGYVALALGAERRLSQRHAREHDALVSTLANRIAADPWLPTYPGERYPCDIAAVLGAIGLHTQTTGVAHPELADALQTYRQAIDPGSGLLAQSVGRDGVGWDDPRASGTALAAYFVYFADPALSATLYQGLRRQHQTLLGLGGLREYPAGVHGVGDIDSGPVLLGISPSATGFALGAARLHGDREMYLSIYRTSHLGLPVHWAGRTGYTVIGPLADAIMLTMFGAAAPG